MKNNSKILTLICFGVILSAMFLPFLEGPRMNAVVSEEDFVVIETYHSPEFGLQLWVFNGFGTLFGITNLVVASVLVLGRFFFSGSLSTAIITAIVFLGSLFTHMYLTSEKQQTVLTDEMLIGFYLMLVAQVILIAQCFTKAIIEPPKDRSQHSDLLDV